MWGIVRSALLVAIAAYLGAASSVPDFSDLDTVDHIQALVRKALDRDPDSLAELGYRYLMGDEVPRDAEKGRAMLDQAVALGSAVGKAQRGEMLLQGLDYPQNVDRGLRDLESAAAAGSAFAARVLAFAYDRGHPISRNPEEALRWYERAAELGDAGAQNNLGWALLKGKNRAPVDAARAVYWLRKAAEQDQPNAQTTLGDAYEKGRGVPRDMALARFWYERAAEQGFAVAMLSLGEMAEKGLGQPPDVEEAAHWYRRAEALGEERGEVRLAALEGASWAEMRLCEASMDGWGPSKADIDPADAAKWCERAALKGNASAQARLNSLRTERPTRGPQQAEPRPN